MSLIPLNVSNIVELLGSRRFTVTWYGVKDSTAALLWVLDNVSHTDWDIIYIEITGNTHPLCTQYVIETAKQLGVFNKLKVVRRENLDFLDVLEKHGIPLIGRYRWCYGKFKEPFLRATNSVQMNGMRADDSVRRKRNLRQAVYSKLMDKVWVVPIWWWKEIEVLEYIKKHSISLNPCYELYGHSGNCIFCPYHTRDRMVRTLRDPTWGAKIMEALEKVHCGRSEAMKRLKDRWVKTWASLAQARMC